MLPQHQEGMDGLQALRDHEGLEPIEPRQRQAAGSDHDTSMRSDRGCRPQEDTLPQSYGQDSGYDGLHTPVTLSPSDKHKVPLSTAKYVAQDPPPPPPKRIFGLRRATFFLILTNIALVITCAILGAEVGIQANKKRRDNYNFFNSPAVDNETQSCNATIKPDPAPSEGQLCFATNATNGGYLAAQPGQVTVECPAANGQKYMVPGTNLTFEKQCGVDWAGNDLGNFPVATMADCLVLCAQLNLYQSSTLGPCVGVAWVYADNQQGTHESYCYPKYRMSGNGSSKVSMESARLLNHL